MRFKPVFAVCAALMLAGPALAPFASADALPMPLELSAEQTALIGVWQEEKTATSYGRGHGFALRTVVFANTDVVITTFSGNSYSHEYNTTTMRGTWTASSDGKTITVSLDQGGGRGKTLTIAPDGPDRFQYSDSEEPYWQPASFRRVSDAAKPPE